MPHALEAILQKCLATRPEDRYPDAWSLAEDLRRFVEHLPLRFAVNPSRREAAVNWARRRRASLALLVLGVALLAGLAAWAGSEDARALVLRGNDAIHRKDPDYRKARDAYLGALALDPSSYKAYWGLSTVADLEGNFVEALEQVRRAIRLAQDAGDRVPASDLALLYHHQGAALLKMKRWEEAYQSYQTAVDRLPTLHSALSGMALAAESARDRVRARRALRRALRLTVDELPARDRASYDRRLAVILENLAHQDREVCPPALDRALASLREAEDRLNEADRLILIRDDLQQSTQDFTAAIVALGFADHYSHAENYPEALLRYTQARDLLDKALARSDHPEKIGPYRQMVLRRIEVDTQALEDMNGPPAPADAAPH